MTIVGQESWLIEGERIPFSARVGCPDAHSVLDTTELRWFVHGPVPLGVMRWFTGSTGVAEQRCDTYRLDGRCDVGVKRRFGMTLELKVRQSLDGRIVLGDGLAGSLETWRRWSPADHLVEPGCDGPWVDVRKSIVKRRYAIDGTEVPFASHPPSTGAGCDVEVAEVAIGVDRAWTFAFAAFGPPATRRAALLGSWRGLGKLGTFPVSGDLRSGRTLGYPAWLAQTVAPDRRVRSAHPVMTSVG